MTVLTKLGKDKAERCSLALEDIVMLLWQASLLGG